MAEDSKLSDATPVVSAEEVASPGGKVLIAHALSRAQGTFKKISKNRVAKVRMKAGGEYTYNYADLSDVIESIRESLHANELAFTQDVSSDGRRLVTQLWHKSGQFLIGSVPLIGGGHTPQELGSALTYARRYGLCTLLGLVAEEDDDGQVAQNASNGAASQSQKRPPAKPPAQPPKNPMMSEGQIKKFFAMCREKGVEDPKLLAWQVLGDSCLNKEGEASTKCITSAGAQELFKALEKMIPSDWDEPSP